MPFDKIRGVLSNNCINSSLACFFSRPGVSTPVLITSQYLSIPICMASFTVISFIIASPLVA